MKAEAQGDLVDHGAGTTVIAISPRRPLLGRSSRIGEGDAGKRIDGANMRPQLAGLDQRTELIKLAAVQSDSSRSCLRPESDSAAA